MLKKNSLEMVTGAYRKQGVKVGWQEEGLGVRQYEFK